MRKKCLILRQIKAFLWHNSKITVKFKGSCLKQDKVTLTPNNVLNLLIFDELGRLSQDLNADFSLKYSLIGAVVQDDDDYYYYYYHYNYY